MDALNDSAEEVIAGSDEEEVSAPQVLRRLEQCWVTEKLSPTLEPHNSEYVDALVDQLAGMERNLATLPKTDFRVPVHRMEVGRIRYVLCAYLRCRLRKIERFTQHLLQQQRDRLPEEAERLSPEERLFAEEYQQSLEQHLKTVALQHIQHQSLSQFDPAKMSPAPNLDAYVFLRVKRAARGVLIQDGVGGSEEVDLSEDGQYLMPYRSIMHMLEKGDVVLM